jgi:putative RecB family exonuclease
VITRTKPRMTTDRLGPTRRAPPLDANAIALQLIGRDYLSHSAVTTYQKCPLQFFFRYVADLPPESVPASLVFGGAIHAALEHHYRRLFEGAEPPSVAEMLAAHDEAWKTDAVVPVQFGKNDSADSLRDLAGRMLEAFRDAAVSNLDGTLLGVEEEFRAAIIPGCPDVLGRLDLVILTSQVLRIVDFKTSRSAWSADKIAESTPQMLLYAELVRPVARAVGATSVRLEWIVLTKTKQPTIETYSIRLDLQQTTRTKAVVRRVWEAIAAGHFYPTPTAMSCATCPYRQACRKWEG